MNNVNATSSSLMANPFQEDDAIKKTVGLSMDDFLKILASSMSNPSMSGDGDSSSNGTDYVSQLAQFATLQEMNHMSEMMNNSLLLGQQQQAFNLMGKVVTVVDENGQEQHGTVAKVSFVGGNATLTIGGKEYEMGAVKEVATPKTEDIAQ